VAEHRNEQVMGMMVGIVVRDDPAPCAFDEAFAWLHAVERIFSPYRSDSEIARLERGELALGGACASVREVLGFCEGLRQRTGGFFDAWASGRLDPSGVVKGWAVERAAQILDHAGARSFLINAGGDILVHGEGTWRIGIQHPLRRDRVACIVELANGAVATSGTYERGAHIVDPHARRPPAGILCVTVMGPDLSTADAYATAAFAMGSDGPGWTGSLDEYEAMTVLEDERVLFTSGFGGHCLGGSPAASLLAA
jgi:FAD:protein FMN transferase